jgi:polysaccharide biosynthesis transport protein
MERKKIADLESIDLLSTLRWIINGKWIILASVVAMALGMYAYKVYTYFPMYTATASMVVSAKPAALISRDGSVNISASDISLAKNLVTTYTSIMKSRRVMDYVRQDLKLDLSVEIIRSYIRLESVSDTQILYLSVTCPVPALAMQIANSIMRVAPQAMMETVEIGSINVLDYAVLPTWANPNDTMKASITAAFVGLLLSCGIVIVSNLLRFFINSARDIDSGLSLEVLEEVPHIQKSAKQKNLLLISHKVNKDYLFIESYRRLSTIMQHICEKDQMKKIMVTSSIPNEGKTTVAVNLALALVQGGNRVLLVDADHHHPSVASFLNIKKVQASGAEDTTPSSMLTDGEVYVLPNGLRIMKCTNSKSGSHVALDLYYEIAEVQGEYDYIIFDTPPTGVLSDALSLSHIVDGAIVVVRQHTCRKKDLEKTVHNLERVEMSILGCVINDVHSWNNRRYYYGKYKKYYHHITS